MTYNLNNTRSLNRLPLVATLAVPLALAGCSDSLPIFGDNSRTSGEISYNGRNIKDLSEIQNAIVKGRARRGEIAIGDNGYICEIDKSALIEDVDLVGFRGLKRKQIQGNGNILVTYDKSEKGIFNSGSKYLEERFAQFGFQMVSSTIEELGGQTSVMFSVCRKE